MPFEFVKSERNQDKLVHNGHVYRKDKVLHDDSVSWRCGQKGCKGRVHNKGRVHFATISDEVRVQFPTNHATQHLIECVRHRANSPYPNPNTVNEVLIPQLLMVTKQGDLFLYHDSGADDPERFLIFATESNMEFLQQNQIWSCDGTFKVCAQLFFQLWTIHALVGNTQVRLVYVLLTCKTEQLYRRVLDVICTNWQFEPTLIICDFEQATINSLKDQFPDARIHGCFFHLAQSIWRHVQNGGLQQR